MHATQADNYQIASIKSKIASYMYNQMMTLWHD